MNLHNDPRFLKRINQIDHVSDMQAVETDLQAEFRRFGAGHKRAQS